MRSLAFAPLVALALASGCAEIIRDSNGQHARIDVTSDGFAQATFSVGDPVEEHRVGACALLQASKFVAHNPAPNSGPIQITAGGESIVLASQYHGHYRDSERRKEPFWSPGATIVLDAPGATAPPFHVELPAPKPIEPIDPPPQDPNERGPDIWALRDLPIVWRPVENATLVVQIINDSRDDVTGLDTSHSVGAQRRIRCEFDARLGTAIVPQALISEMTLGRVTMYISSLEERVVNAYGWHIRVRAYTDAIRERHARIDDRAPKGPHGEESGAME